MGLLAQARNLQADLDRMAQTADTGSAAGRAQVLQEATLFNRVGKRIYCGDISSGNIRKN